MDAPGKWYTKEGWENYYFILRRGDEAYHSLRYSDNIKGIEYCQPRFIFSRDLYSVKFEEIDRERVHLTFKEIFSKKPNPSIKVMLFKMSK